MFKIARNKAKKTAKSKKTSKTKAKAKKKAGKVLKKAKKTVKKTLKKDKAKKVLRKAKTLAKKVLKKPVRKKKAKKVFKKAKPAKKKPVTKPKSLKPKPAPARIVLESKPVLPVKEEPKPIEVSIPRAQEQKQEKPLTGTVVGKISHYYSHISVAVVEVTGTIKVGDRIRIHGSTTDFEQTVESMQIEHLQIQEATPGQSIGLKVLEHVREHDQIYKI